MQPSRTTVIWTIYARYAKNTTDSSQLILSLIFFKGDFHFPSKQEGVQLKNDVIVIIWRTKTGRFGISHEALITNEDSPNNPDVVDAGDVFRSTDSVDSPTVPVVKKPCRVRAIVSSKNLQVGTTGERFIESCIKYDTLAGRRRLLRKGTNLPYLIHDYSVLA